MSPLSALLWLLAAGAGFAYWNAARAAALATREALNAARPA